MGTIAAGTGSFGVIAVGGNLGTEAPAGSLGITGAGTPAVGMPAGNLGANAVFAAAGRGIEPVRRTAGAIPGPGWPAGAG